MTDSFRKVMIAALVTSTLAACGVFRVWDPLQELDLDPVDLFDPLQHLAVGMPDEGAGDGEIGGARRRWRQAFERAGDAFQKGLNLRLNFRHGRYRFPLFRGARNLSQTMLRSTGRRAGKLGANTGERAH